MEHKANGKDETTIPEVPVNGNKADRNIKDTSSETDPEPLTALEGRAYVALTHAPLDILGTLARVRDPGAGAVVMFAGTTRNSFDSRPVSTLHYSAYEPLALRTLLSIATQLLTSHAPELIRVALVHRLGEVPIGEESVLICVSAVHRKEAWRAGEEALEVVKERVEVWKREVFGDEDGEGVWRENVEGKIGKVGIIDNRGESTG